MICFCQCTARQSTAAAVWWQEVRSEARHRSVSLQTLCLVSLSLQSDQTDLHSTPLHHQVKHICVPSDVVHGMHCNLDLILTPGRSLRAWLAHF